VVAKLVQAPEHGAPLGGLKVLTASGWFAARPSGTENLVKIYAESFQSEAHLRGIIKDARLVVGRLNSPCS